MLVAGRGRNARHRKSLLQRHAPVFRRTPGHSHYGKELQGLREHARLYYPKTTIGRNRPYPLLGYPAYDAVGSTRRDLDGQYAIDTVQTPRHIYPS